MESLNLDIEDGYRIYINALLLLKVCSKGLLLVILDCLHPGKESSITLVLKKLLKLERILLVSASDCLCDKAVKLLVTAHKPSSEGNTVCLIVELLRINLIEVVKLCILQNLCMDCSNTIDGISVMNIHMSHMYSVILINDIYALIIKLSSYSLIKLLDNRNEMRYYLLEVFDRPLLKSFCKNCMVGISTGLRYYINSLIHSECLVINKDSDKLGNNH